ncbi:hypothetical protein [Nonomuraea turcica]|uniref:hypothetical protein n=1 Tax=Nonomuraea sp. G32 TaxID=3067274 RepID=UPI00273B32C4|nr:hypothetical protein [Nonomuraea sp. G32]MDP4504175.1 hypothetical protein [Nonomuraea sp. G32]
MTRRALLIANTSYDDQRLRQVRAPPSDMAELERVLADPTFLEDVAATALGRVRLR